MVCDIPFFLNLSTYRLTVTKYYYTIRTPGSRTTEKYLSLVLIIIIPTQETYNLLFILTIIYTTEHHSFYLPFAFIE